MAKEFKRYLVTSALPYANGPVHIGHLAGVYIPSDIYTRYLRLKGCDVISVCGSDEHGVPITIKARKEGVTPQQIVDRYHNLIKKSFEGLGMSFDIYSRTTSPTHHKTASDFFRKLYDDGKFIEQTSQQYYDEEAGQFLADRYIVGTCPHCQNERAYGDQCEKCGSTHLTREEDVLDTWFSSALWPFSTLGWPDLDSADLKYWYPTSVMVTGYDIIFFWVARMIFSGMEQMKKEPFKTVFIHGLVRDDKGRKMSKSLGNGIDPLEMAEKYGADALRFNLITGNSPGNDMRFFVEKCEAMRNFANKIWNASRFVMMNLSIDKVQLPEKLELEDKWVLSRLNTLIREVTDNLEAYELGVASAKIYDFIWDTYCDWYIELTKTRLNGEDEAAKLAAENVLCYVLLRIMELLHPFMPFITEEIWQALPHEGDYLITAKWPEYQDALHFPEAEAAMEAVKDAISAIRARRAEMNVPPSRKAQVVIVAAQPENYQMGAHFITRMAYASELTVQTAAPADLTGMVTVATHDATIYMPMAELVDIAKELARIAAERKKAEENLQRIEAKLANESFTSRAPENVVNAEREKAEKARALIAKLDESAAAMQI